MAVTPWPIVVDGKVGDVPTNLIPKADSDKKLILEGSPGLLELCDLTDCTEVRGLYSWNNYLYAVARRGSDSVLWRVDAAGAFSELGFFSTSFTGPVWIKNNLTQLLIVDGVSGYVYTPASNNFVQITDADFPGALACAYQDTYGLFIQPNSQNWFFSAPTNFLSFDALDVYAKEGGTDNVVSILSTGTAILVFGEETFETWYDAGGDNSSPANPTFKRNEGGVFQYGCGAPATACNFDNTPTWLSDKGQLIRFSGNVPQIISSDMFGRDIKAMTTYSDAVAFVYVDGEHTYYQITFPTAGLTYVYDAKTKLFHKRNSYIDGSDDFGRHRANCYALLDNKHYVGDYINGKIYEMSSDYYDDNGHELQAILYGTEIDNGLKRGFFPEIQILMEMGVGPESGLDPQMVLQYSSNRGKTWSNERWASIGKIGEYNNRAIWRRNGSDFKRMYRVIITDAVPRTIYGIDWGSQ